MPFTLLTILLETALKGAVVLVIVTAATGMMRRRSAAVRHAAWVIALGTQLVLPAVAMFAPSWGAPLMDAPAWLASGRATAVVDTSAGTKGVPSAAATRGVAFAGTSAAPTEVSQPRTDVGEGAIAARASGRQEVRPHLAGTLTIVWLIGAGLILLQLCVGTIGVWRLAARSHRVLDSEWLALAHQLTVRLRIARPLTLLRGDSLAVPVTWGVVYPVVLLPADAESWDGEQRRYVLVHEMAHIRRLDALTHLIGQVTLAIFWFDPLVWFAVSRMRVEREHACDDYVLRIGTPASRYANDLLAMVRSIGRPNRRATPSAFATLAMARRSEFEGRMLAILEDDAVRDPLTRPGLLAGTIIAGGLALAVGGYRPVAARELGGAPVTRMEARVPAAVPRTQRPESTQPRRTRITGAPSPMRVGSIDRLLASMRADDTKTALLAQYARSGDDTLIAAAIRAVPSLLDDSQKSVVLSQMVPGAIGGGNVQLRDAFFAALESITSDEDRAIPLVRAATLNREASPVVTQLVLRSASRMRTPDRVSMVLITVAQRHQISSDSLRALYLQIANAIAADSVRQQTLTALALAIRDRRTASP